MANVYITAYDSAAEVALGDPTDFLVAIIGSTNSEKLSEQAGKPRQRKRVRIQADADCFVNFFSNEADPTVTDGTDAMPLGADNPEYHDMEVGRVLKAIAR